jgi:hypothetical protein
MADEIDEGEDLARLLDRAHYFPRWLKEAGVDVAERREAHLCAQLSTRGQPKSVKAYRPDGPKLGPSPSQ